jgi:nucleoside 2-deoxyribosyltransferase
MKCPICGNQKCVQDVHSRYGFVCQDCGKYRLGPWAYSDISSGKSRSENRLLFHKYASVLLERNLKGLNDGVALEYDGNGHLVFYATSERVDSHYPDSYLEKFERGFCNIVRSLKRSPLWSFKMESLAHNLRNLLFLEDTLVNPLRAVRRMVEIGWFEEIRSETLSEGHSFRLTLDGIRHYEETANRNPSSNAFLAMWFGVEGNEVFRQSVETGVKNAGYTLQVVDEEQYNGFIMDKVVNMINDAAFVVADLSAMPEVVDGEKVLNGVRGGVYWEAGYAAGQKKQVILTCHEGDESLKRIHFDLQQHNQIRWKISNGRAVASSGIDLSEAIEQRVRATVGARKISAL